MLEYGTANRPGKGRPAWDGGETARQRLGSHMRTEIDMQREQWHKEHFNTPLLPDLVDEKKGQNKILGPKEVSRILQDNRRQKKEDRPYGRSKGKKDLSDVLSKRVNPDLPTGVELRAYEEKYRQIKQEDIKHLSRYGHLPADFKNRKGNEEIVEDPEIKKLMRSEETEDEGAGEKETIDLTGEGAIPTFRTPEEVKATRQALMGQTKKKEGAKEIRRKPQEKRKVRETDQENETPRESERGRTMQKRQEREREKGTKRVKLGKRANTSKSPGREKRRAESPLRIESKAGMFSEVKDSISIAEETADVEGETMRENVQQELHQQGSGPENDSDEDTVGYEESGEDIHTTSSSEEDENTKDDGPEGDDQEDDGDGGDKSGGDREAPGGANL